MKLKIKKMITEVLKQNLEMLEDELKEMEISIAKLNYANKLRMPISKYIWDISMISNLNRAEVSLFKPIAMKYLDKDIEISKLLLKIGDELMKKFDKTKDDKYRIEAIEYYTRSIENANYDIINEPKGIIELEDEKYTDAVIISQDGYNNFFSQVTIIKKQVWKRYFEIPKDERQDIQSFYEIWKDTDEANEIYETVKQKDIANMADFENKVRYSRR